MDRDFITFVFVFGVLVGFGPVSMLVELLIKLIFAAVDRLRRG